MNSTIRQLRKDVERAGDVVAVLRETNAFADIAVARFHDGVAATGRVVEVRGPWFAPTNRTRRIPDAIVYRFRPTRKDGEAR